jgi:hypothetical protein
MSRRSTLQEDTELAGIEAALRRAARRARELGERTGTPVYVLRNGKIVDLTSERQQKTHANKELQG